MSKTTLWGVATIVLAVAGCGEPRAAGVLPTDAPDDPTFTPDPQNEECRGAIGQVAVDNLVIEANDDCTLTGTSVVGNLVIEAGARLVATGISVDGSVQAEGAAHVELSGEVDSDVQLTDGGSLSLRGLEVGGSVSLERNEGAIAVEDCVIGGNLQVYENADAVLVRGNVIDGNLQCSDNAVAPAGADNDAADKEGQCAEL